MAHLNEMEGGGPLFKIARGPADHARRRVPAQVEPRRAAAAVERAARRDEPRRPAPVRRPRVRADHRLGQPPARHDARHHRPLAGARPQRHPLRGDGEARLRLRDQLVALVGHQDPRPDAPVVLGRERVRTDGHLRRSRLQRGGQRPDACSPTSSRARTCGATVAGSCSSTTAPPTARSRSHGRTSGDLPVEVLRAGPQPGPGQGVRPRLPARARRSRRDDELIVTLESDTTSDLDALEAMLAAARDGADVVLASHHAGGELVNVSRHRRFLSKAASSAIRRGGGLDASTVSSFFRVYRASVAARRLRRATATRSSASAASPARPRS